MGKPRFRWLMALLLGSAALAAATWSMTNGSGEPPLLACAAESPEEESRFAPLVLSGGIAPAYAGEPSDAERDAMEDGVVMWEEYYALVSETVACLESAGFTVDHFTNVSEGLFGSTTSLLSAEPGIEITSYGRINYAASGGASPNIQSNGETVTECKRASAVVEGLWQGHTAPSEAELQAGREAIGDCLRRAGVEISPRPSRQDLKSVALLPRDQIVSGEPWLNPAYRDCELEVTRSMRLR